MEKQRIWIRGLEKGPGVGWREKVVGRGKFDLGVANQKKYRIGGSKLKEIETGFNLQINHGGALKLILIKEVVTKKLENRHGVSIWKKSWLSSKINLVEAVVTVLR